MEYVPLTQLNNKVAFSMHGVFVQGESLDGNEDTQTHIQL